MTTDEQRGIYGKYRVERIGGTPGKHDECWYYVLDWEHDKFARPALEAYATACSDEYPDLSRDLFTLLGRPMADRDSSTPTPATERLRDLLATELEYHLADVIGGSPDWADFADRLLTAEVLAEARQQGRPTVEQLATALYETHMLDSLDYGSPVECHELAGAILAALSEEGERTDG
jgi:hypothetical protein